MRRRKFIIGASALTAYMSLKQEAKANFLFGVSPFNVPGLPTWSSAINAVRSGTSNARLLVLSDSTGVGFGSPNGDVGVGATATSWPTVLASLLNVASFPAEINLFWNDGNTNSVGTTMNQLDPRVSFGANWGVLGGNFGGGSSFGNSTDTTPFTFTPGIAFDTIEVYYVAGLNIGQTVDIGGASLGTITSTTGAAKAILKQTFTCTLGVNAVNVRWNLTGSAAIVVGINVFKSTQKSIQIFNVSGAGYKINDILNGDANSIVPSNYLPAIAPNLTIICCTINDGFAATNSTTFQTETQSLISACQAYGDVLLMTGAPTASTGVPIATQAVYIADYQALATSDSLPLINMTALWGSEAAANAAGLMSPDGVHPNQPGYAAGGGGLLGISQIVFNAITTP